MERLNLPISVARMSWKYHEFMNAVVRASRSALRSLNTDLQPKIKVERTAHATAAKVAEALEGSTQFSSNAGNR